MRFWYLSYGPCRDKACHRGFRQSETQTSLLSYRDLPEKWTSTCSKFRYNTFQKANNKVADQSAHMRMLVCAFIVRKPWRQVFSWRGLSYSEGTDAISKYFYTRFFFRKIGYITFVPKLVRYPYVCPSVTFLVIVSSPKQLDEATSIFAGV